MNMIASISPEQCANNGHSSDDLQSKHWRDRYFVALQAAIENCGTPVEEVHLKLADHFRHMHNFISSSGRTAIDDTLADRWMAARSDADRSALRRQWLENEDLIERHRLQIDR